MTEFFRRVSYWKMALFRVLIFAFVSGINYFLSHTETWGEDTWHQTGGFAISRLLLGCSVEMIMVVIAFLDQTMARLHGNAPPVKHPDA